MALAILRCSCGVPAQGFMQWLSRHRNIWSGHVTPVQNPSHRDQQPLDSLTWAARLTRRGGTQPQAASSQPAPGQLPVWVYRAMRQDGDDLEPTPGWTCPVGLDLRLAVLQAVSRGSRERSPFLHASKDWQMAHRWCHKIMHPTHPDIATSTKHFRSPVIGEQKCVTACHVASETSPPAEPAHLLRFARVESLFRQAHQRQDRSARERVLRANQHRGVAPREHHRYLVRQSAAGPLVS